MKTPLFLGFLLFSAAAFGQPRPIGFLSQDSLLQIYYQPKIQWADSIAQLIRRQATGHHLAEIYQQIKALQQKNHTVSQPPSPYPTTHSAVFWEADASKKRRKK